MKARYHKFTGEIPVVFVEDAKKFMQGLGVNLNESDDEFGPGAFMQEVTMGNMKMLVFSEGIMRTLYGGVKTSMVEAHLALWAGTQKYPTNEVNAYKYALQVAERYGRTKTYDLLRGKLAEDHGVKVRKHRAHLDRPGNSVEAHLFTEQDKVPYIQTQILTEALSLSDMKKKIQALVKSADEDILRKVFSFLSRDNKDYDNTVKIMTNIGIPERNARVVLDMSLETGDFESLAAYMPKRTMTLAKLSKASDFIAAAKVAIPGMSDQFANWLVNYQWPTTPSMGAGEAALVILLKDGNKPAKGDVGIGSRELEVKGENGRLKGQHGYGTGEMFAKIWYTELSLLMKKVHSSKRIPVPKPGGTEYNCTKTGNKGWAMNPIARLLVAEGVVTDKEIAALWRNAIQAVFNKMSLSWIGKFVTKTGEVHDVTGFLTKWLAESAKYYHKIEGFEAILLLNRKGKFIVINISDFDKLASIVKWTPPNFSSRAGSQGSAFGITVK
jgi:hypothetical protein